MKSSIFTERRRFIAILIEDLHHYGTSTYALESMVAEVSNFLGLDIALIATPTSVNFTIRSKDREHEYTNCMRLPYCVPNLGALADVHDVIKDLSLAKITINGAHAHLIKIQEAGHRYALWMRAMAFGAASGGFAMLMQTSASNVLCAVVLGMMVFCLCFLGEKFPRVQQMLEPLVTLTTSLVACYLNTFEFIHLNEELVVLSSVIILVPGLTLTIGLNEISVGHLLAGMSRVVDAMMILFKLYFGAFLGITVSTHIWGEAQPVMGVALPSWTIWCAVASLGLALVTILNNRLKEAPFAVLAGFVSYGSYLLGIEYFDYMFGAFIGAFMLGLYCNAFSWGAGAPASLLSLHGLVVLVPGSKMFIALDNLISTSEIVHVEQLGQQTFFIFMSLVAGFVFANVFLPEKYHYS
jgi:uncharacterized membrane protein YjjP (DUF1212 family)